MIVYTLGPAGTYSHEAAQKIFVDAEIRFAPNFDGVFDALAANPDAVGVVPVENSLHGSIDEVLDLLRETDIRIFRMHDLAIKHAFGAADPSKVKVIASHTQALRQCRKWLREKFPGAQHLSVVSTSAAADLAAKDSTIGAIASAAVLKNKGLKIIAEDIEGNGNTTRFAVVSVHDPFPEKKRTQMMLVLHPTSDRPGLLHDMLVPFKIYDLSLTRIESRPAGTKIGDYIFFIDFVGSPQDPKVQNAMEDLSTLAEVKVLGEW